MSDLISRQDAIERLREFANDDMTSTEKAIGADYCVDLIRTLPSAEPERKKGEWIDGMPYVNSHWKVCSECHVSAPDSCGGFNFCPNCGARMEMK